MIPHTVIDEIKYRNTVEDVISSYVTLSRSGVNFKGLCPFHSEKTPSFTVFTGTQSFYCFGCGTGGDVVSFIMKAENLDYVSALEFLAKRAGISIPEDNRDGMPQGVSRKRVIEMNTDAARFFRSALFDEAKGAPARAYLAKRRLSQTTVKHFGLGYAPNSFNELRDFLRKKGYSDEEMTEGALCARSEKTGNLYDIFRNRVMFPLIDTAGNVVAFGGRVLDDSKPKYLNSKDTPAFKKSKMLFAMNFAKNYSTKGIILCEGNVDVVSLHQEGFENAVATLGTAIGPEHARLIKKYTEKVFVAYDGDNAGRNATAKAVKILGEVGLETRVVELKDAKDPDEYVHKFGKLAFEKLLDEGRSVYDYKIEAVLAKYNIENAEEKSRAAAELCFECAKLQSKISIDIFAMKIAKALSVDVKSVEYDVAKAQKTIVRRNKKEMREKMLVNTMGITDRVNRDYSKNPRGAKLEEIVLGMMLYCPELLEKALNGENISADDFITDYGKRLFRSMREGVESGGFDISQLNEKFTSDEVSRAAKLMASREKLTNSDSIFFDNLNELKKERTKDNDSFDALAERLKREKDSGST